MQFYYISHSGIRINFYEAPYYLNDTDLLSYEWGYETENGRILNITKGTTDKSLEIYVMPEFGIENRNIVMKQAVDYLLSVLDADVAEKESGRLYTDTGYYLECLFVKSEKSDWNMGINFMFNSFTLLVPRPFWIREHEHNFKAADISSTNNKRYMNKYAYRYANGLNNTYIVNDHYTECNFLLRIYGPCVKPTVYIGGYEYHVDITLEDGEYLEIDSAAETVTKCMISGIRVNAFHNRSFKNSVFRPVQTGQQDVFWDGKFDFDLILYEGRSEPRWS